MHEMDEKIETRRETIDWLYNAGGRALDDVQAYLAAQIADVQSTKEAAAQAVSTAKAATETWQRRHETLRGQIEMLLAHDEEA